MLAAATLGAIELSARIAQPVLLDGPIDAAATRAEIQAVAAGDDGGARAGNREEVIHPYLGFVGNPASKNELVDALRGVPISEYGFNDDKSPIQSAQPGRLVVGIFGGSVAHFFSLEGIEALRAELARSPRFRPPHSSSATRA